jgi:hypothetical protein
LSFPERWYAFSNELLGGQWSKGDVFALFGVIAAVLAIPGMPKLFHWDTDSPAQHSESGGTTGSDAALPTPKPAQKARDVASGQVSFGCDESLAVETPVISFGKNPRDIESIASWINTDNVKTQNQSVINVQDPTGHHLAGVKAAGTITGRDSQNILGVKGLPRWWSRRTYASRNLDRGRVDPVPSLGAHSCPARIRFPCHFDACRTVNDKGHYRAQRSGESLTYLYRTVTSGWATVQTQRRF